MTEEEILRIVGPMMDNCLEGSNEVNHAKHVRDFTDRLKNVVTPGNLKSAGSRAAKQSLYRYLMVKTTAAHFSLRQQKITLANRPSPGQPKTTNNKKLGSV